MDNDVKDIMNRRHIGRNIQKDSCIFGYEARSFGG